MSRHPKRRPHFLLLCALAFTPALAQAQGLLEGLKEKARETADRLGNAADKAGEAAGTAADALGKATNRVVDMTRETVESAQYDLRDEASPQATREKIDAMATATLERLFAEQPAVQALFEESAGYAVFDTRQVQWGLAAGYGRGVAVDRRSGRRTYMKMGSAGVGIGFGAGGFDTQIVALFKDGFDFNKFVTQGFDASAEAGTMIGDDKEQLALHYENGRALFVLTQKGWKVSAKLAGTRYWPDETLGSMLPPVTDAPVVMEPVAEPAPVGVPSQGGEVLPQTEPRPVDGPQAGAQ